MRLTTINTTAAITMTSREIAELLDCRHDNVKVTIERLVAKGVISTPATQEYSTSYNRTFSEYCIEKRDSYVIVAQLSPEFTAKLVDRWQELEAQVAKPAALPRTFAEALRLAADMEEQKEQLALENARMRPAAEVGEAVGRRKNISVLDFARHLEGVNIMQVQNWLGSKGYLKKDKDGTWYVPGKYRDTHFSMGYAGPARTQVLVLEKGQLLYR